MKRLATCAVLSLAALLTLPACTTTQEGVKTNMFSQWGTVDAGVKDTVAAGEAVLNDLELNEVETVATGVDGKVTGKKADDSKITISIDRVTDDNSKVKVSVGSMGDTDMGKAIIAKMKEELAE